MPAVAGAPVDHVAVQLAFRAQLLSLSTLPAGRSWENVAFDPTAGQEYIDEQYIPATVVRRGLSTSGALETTGLYVINWYGVAGNGLQLAKDVKALLALFPPGLALTASDGTVIRMRGDVGPSRGQIRQIAPGWAVCTVTIPFRIIQ